MVKNLIDWLSNNERLKVMAKKFKVVIYRETFTQYEVEAESESEAIEKTCLGKAEEIEVTVKESEIEEVKEIVEISE